MYDGGVRSPMFAYWPGNIKAGTTSEHISAFWDMLPTFSDLTGEAIVGETDGVSLLPTLLGNPKKQKQHQYLYWELYEGIPNSAVRYGKWKAVVLNRRKTLDIELYNVDMDPGESKNIANQYPEIVEEIKNFMNNSHQTNPFWDARNSPLFNADAAAKANGVTADYSNPY